MNKVLICDDDLAFANDLRNEIRTLLDQMRKHAQIHIYEKAEDIPIQALEDCDIAFLDIDFPSKTYTGMDIARKLRKRQRDAVIIFVTNFPEYAPEGYEVQAFRYLLKNEIHKKLKPYLTQALAQLATVKRTLPINVSGDIIKLPMEDILYVESQQHTVVVYVLNPDKKQTVAYSFYSSLSKLEEQLSTQGFLRIHKSYLVNMKHIQRYQCKEAVLSNGVTLKVSEKNYAEQKKKYLLWKGRQ